ncbi:hypothetical protein B0H11DRAFT_1712867, partial [Mycena galericulata]
IYAPIHSEALPDLVEEARVRYVESSRPHVVIRLADPPHHYDSVVTWSIAKNKTHRPLSSIILPDGIVSDLERDVEEFITAEDWYVEAGIPYRRGYLLHGPPGTGKTSTIYALAGALRLKIYALSLSSRRSSRHFDSELPWLSNAHGPEIVCSETGKLCIEKAQFCIQLNSLVPQCLPHSLPTAAPIAKV